MLRLLAIQQSGDNLRVARAAWNIQRNGSSPGLAISKKPGAHDILCANRVVRDRLMKHNWQIDAAWFSGLWFRRGGLVLHQMRVTLAYDPSLFEIKLESVTNQMGVGYTWVF